jgi:hypothetical protein
MGRTSFIHYAAACALAFSSAPAAADNERYLMATGNDYFAVCTSAILQDSNLCMAYTMGVIRGLSSGEFASQVKSGRPVERSIFCAPESVSDEQLLAVILKFLRDRPEVRHVDSASLIWRALFGAFPCTKQ